MEFQLNESKPIIPVCLCTFYSPVPPQRQLKQSVPHQVEQVAVGLVVVAYAPIEQKR
tara:strand:- start:1073 stop:1243 length:171 start_codon:yes stop_codon:yes gene_type:complete